MDPLVSAPDLLTSPRGPPPAGNGRGHGSRHGQADGCPRQYIEISRKYEMYRILGRQNGSWRRVIGGVARNLTGTGCHTLLPGQAPTHFGTGGPMAGEPG